jgi:myo-inositol-1(or 4)-monophosphatase
MSADERVGTALRERLAADLALRGGRLALEYFHRARTSWTPGGSTSAEADGAIHQSLATEIARVFPDDVVMGGEGRRDDGRSQSRYAWVLAPVDGTSSSERRLPGFSVSIGVFRDRQPFAGAVYDPLTRWLFTACAGRGAWLNDWPLRTRPVPLSCNSLVSLHTPLEDAMPSFVEDWLRRYRLGRFGSTALDLCYVALGALDLVHHQRASLWDIGGAAPVVLEAGGVLTGADGGPVFPATSAHLRGAPLAILAGNPVSHAQALAGVAASCAPGR